MRFPLLPLALATAIAVWTFVPGPSVGAEKPRPPKPIDEGWVSILRTPDLSLEERRILERLAPRLPSKSYLALPDRHRELLIPYAQGQLDPATRLARCWAPDTPPAILASYHAAEELAFEELAAAADGEENDPRFKANQFLRRWSVTATNGGGEDVQGRPVTLTWSVVPDGTPIDGNPDIGDRDGPSDLRAFLAGIYPGANTGAPENQPWFRIMQGAFDRIAAQSGVRYVYESNDDGAPLGSASGQLGVRGDIRIGGHHIDGGNGTLAYNFFPNNADMVIDTGDLYFSQIFNDSIRLSNVFEHEHGHGLGLEHVCPINDTKLMEPFITTSYRGIRFDDIYTIQRWYGDQREQHGNVRNNDSTGNAAPLPIVYDTPFAEQWLSIDDNDDIDHYSFHAAANSTLTVRVLPPSLTYLEGPVEQASCTAGTTFDPTDVHDLTLELIAPDRSTILAASTANPAGEPEEIIDFITPRSGTHYLRINGDSTNAAQLYRLEVLATAPGVAIASSSRSIINESFTAPNGSVDPGETVQVDVTLHNSGSLPANDLQAALTGPAAFTGFTTRRNYGTLPSGGSATRSFVFGLAGQCGETITLDLEVTTDGGADLGTIPLRFTLGKPATVLHADFDAAPGLPAGWTSTENGPAGAWAVSGTAASSPPSSLFAPNVSGIGNSFLTSPPSTLGASGGTLTFRHFYNTEPGFDGCVLEVSSGGDPWQDIVAAGASVTEGPYNNIISTSYGSPIGGRNAWTGNSNGFITTRVELDASFGGRPVRFRWRLANDASLNETGWYVDDITLDTEVCNPPIRVVTLTLLDGTAAEYAPSDRARLSFSTNLPPISPIPVPLSFSGSADRFADVHGLGAVTIPSGQTLHEVVVRSGLRRRSGGPRVPHPRHQSRRRPWFPPAIPQAVINISDTPYGTWAFAHLGLGPGTLNRPLEDRDGDLSFNLEEYAWQSGADSPLSRPHLQPRREGGFIRLDAPLAGLPPDLAIRAESSPDLQHWTRDGVEILADGFRIPAGETRRFLRLVYELLPPSP